MGARMKEGRIEERERESTKASEASEKDLYDSESAPGASRASWRELDVAQGLCKEQKSVSDASATGTKRRRRWRRMLDAILIGNRPATVRASLSHFYRIL